MSGSVSRVLAVARRELSASAASPIMWVFLTLYLFLSAFCAFVAGDFLGSDQADLGVFFSWQQWLFLIFVPALGMPFWSEELRSGTFELLRSFPGSLWECVLGKYLAGVSMLGIGLLLTSPTPLTAFYLGNPDMGAVASGYLGALLLGASCLSAACLCSALSRSQTASFLLSMTLCSMLTLSGWPPAVETLASWGVPDWASSLLSGLSFSPRFASFIRGVLDSADFVFFVSVQAFFLLLATAALGFASTGARAFSRGSLSDPSSRAHALNFVASAAMALAAFIAVNIIAASFPVRVDVTNDRAYSLSKEAAAIASGLKEPVKIRFYFTSSRRMPDNLKQYGERVEWLLDEFARASKGAIRLQKIRPEPDSDDEEAAAMDGVKPMDVNTGDKVFLGLTVSKGTRLSAMPFLSPLQESLLEAEICRSILNVSKTAKPKVGVMSSLPVLGQQMSQGAPQPMAPSPSSMPAKPWFAFAELQEDYELVKIPMDASSIPDVKALVILHPCAMPEQAQFAVDQYLLRGGRIVAFLDPRSFYAILKSQQDHSFVDKIESDMDRLLPAWGVSYGKTIMVSDMSFAYRKSMPDKMVTNPMVLNLTREGISQDSRITASLNSVSMYFSGCFKVEPPQGVVKETLLSTSTQSQAISSFIGDRPELALRNFAPSGVKMDLAVCLRGSFKSAFQPEPAPAGFLKSSEKEGEAILFADSDMLFNDVCVKSVEDALGQRSVVRVNDNVSLFQNVIEALCGSEELSKVRTRLPMKRPFTKINDLKAKAELAYKNKILELERELMETQKKMNELQAEKPKDQQQSALSPEQKLQLKEFLAKKEEARKNIKALRGRLRSDLESLSSRFKLLNVVLVPLLVAVAGLLWIFARGFGRRRT